MSTSNFSYENELFIIPGSDEETFDEYEMNDARDVILNRLQKEFRGKEYSVMACDRGDNDRNYGGTVIADIEFERNGKVIEAEVIMRSGYYSGMNVDYRITDVKDNWNYDEVPPLAYIESAKDRILRGIERSLEGACRRAIRLGTFSNGESVYQYA